MKDELAAQVKARVNEVVEEETSRKLGELNVITDISEQEGGAIRIKFTPLSPYSPVAVSTCREIRSAALSVDGVKRVTVECSGHMMDELVNRLVNGQEKSSK